jgi:putative metalloprotease
MFSRFALLALFGFWLFRILMMERIAQRMLREQSEVLADAPLWRQVARFEKTLGVAGLQIRVLNSPGINALAAPGTEIYLTKGLLQVYRRGHLTLSEVAAIIAHELGHVALKHTKRRLNQIRLQSIIPFWFSWIFGLIFLRMSREDEFEADAFAITLMDRAGQDPHAFASALKKTDAMLKREAAQQGTVPHPPVAWLASHPPTEQRIAAVNELIKSTLRPA